MKTLIDILPPPQLFTLRINLASEIWKGKQRSTYKTIYMKNVSDDTLCIIEKYVQFIQAALECHNFIQ